MANKSKKKNKQVKKTLNTHQKDRFDLSLTYRFWLWIAAWIGALIFTQALRAPASTIVFIFVSIAPWLSLIYTLIGRGSLKIYMLSDTSVTEKCKPFSYEFRLINESILPFPFIDAFIKLPRRSSVRTTERCVRIVMPGMSNYTVKGNVSFRFRGTYEIGLTSFYIYDFFRIFRLRSQMNAFSTVYVLPRKLILDTSEALSVSDSAMHTVKAPYSFDKLEVSDIRNYRPGDSLKSIHWKLSSKSEEFIVNDYNTGSADISYIFCDMSAHFPDEAPIKDFVNPFEKPADDAEPPKPDITSLINDEAYEDINEFCADGAIELTVASILRELRAGREITLMWYDSRSEMGAFCCEIHSIDDFDPAFRLFASAPTVHCDKKISRLAASAGDTQDAKVTVILPVLDEATVDDICEIPRLTEIVAYSAEERFLDPDARRKFIEHCREQFSARGIKLIDGKLDDESILATESPLENGAEESGGNVGVDDRPENR